MTDAAKIVVITGIAMVVFGLFMMVSARTGSWGWFNWFSGKIFGFIFLLAHLCCSLCCLRFSFTFSTNLSDN
jgi:hypothetical protein